MPSLAQAFRKKLAKRIASCELNTTSDTGSLAAVLQKIAYIVQRHEAKPKSLDAQKSAACDAIEAHCLHTVMEQVAVVVGNVDVLKSGFNFLAKGGEGFPDMRALKGEF